MTNRRTSHAVAVSHVRAVALVLVTGAASTIAQAQVMLGQVDTFEDGTNAGWFEGGPSPNQPTVVTGGSFDGSNYLENLSSGESGAGGRQVMLNVVNQWAGDYTAQGIDSISMWLRADPAGEDLAMRLYFSSFINATNTSIGIASSEAQMLVADGEWRLFNFELTPDSMEVVSGSGTVELALTAIEEFRILSAADFPTRVGDQVFSILGVDNITALPAPAGVTIVGVAGLCATRRRR